MAEEFLSDSDRFSTARSNREPVRVIVVGSRQGVTNIIYMLHDKGFVLADEWSDLQPEPMTGKFMSVVTKYVRVD